ncbi:AAA family ATPase [Bhargavaea cecembensis]|uniref:AAA family ATPase n=1 Tax=Bhargavaea cecembensis TaxID=394098 RepID=UPI001E30AEFD|nr:AAA family ATPase [Bhargavaea cecembensis]
MACKIHIIGAVGSGKTTLARELSEKLGIPYYEIDNVAWERRAGGDVRRIPEDRDKLLHSIVSSDTWITEGTHPHDWVLPCFREAELIVFLDPPYRVRVERIIKRFVLQKAGIETAHYRPHGPSSERCSSGTMPLSGETSLNCWHFSGSAIPKNSSSYDGRKNWIFR